jgi:hypothetical protein
VLVTHGSMLLDVVVIGILDVVVIGILDELDEEETPQPAIE